MRDRGNCTRLLVSAMLALALALTVPAAADKLADIKARGRLLIGVTESSPPFSFRDGGKGIVGYDVDLAERVAKSLGVTTEKIAIINAERIAALQQDRVDVVAVIPTPPWCKCPSTPFAEAVEIEIAELPRSSTRKRRKNPARRACMTTALPTSWSKAVSRPRISTRPSRGHTRSSASRSAPAARTRRRLKRARRMRRSTRRRAA